MMKADPLKLRVAAGTGFLAVALGAFGAHAFKAQLEAGHMVDVWKTATEYHLAHSVVMLVLAYAMPGPRGRCIFTCFLTGVILFSGSLYVMGLTGMKWLGMITPAGGVFMLVGWFLLAIRRAGDD